MYYYGYKEFLLISEKEILNSKLNKIKDVKEYNRVVFLKEKGKKKYAAYSKLDNINLIENNMGLETLFLNEMLKLDDTTEVYNNEYLQEKIKSKECAFFNSSYNLEILFSNLDKALEPKKKVRVHILGLGDVGGTLLIGLRLLGNDVISEIGIFDLDENRLNRYEKELNQIVDANSNDMPRVKKISSDELFNCDMFIFTASKTVPSVGSEIVDVRQYQKESNSKIIKIYAKEARKQAFKGIFAVVSDPVDELCYVAYKESNTNDFGVYDGKGILPEKIKGYGLGVMYGRSLYYAKEMDIDSSNIRVFGPHGKNLIVANDIENYNNKISLELTEKVVNANMDIRNLGYKPYIAPALSSGAFSIINTLKGNYQYSTVFAGGCYFGIKNKETSLGLEIERLKVDEKLYNRIKYTYKELLNG